MKFPAAYTVISDEVSQDLAVVRAFVREFQLPGIELRSLNGRAFKDLTREDVAAVVTHRDDPHETIWFRSVEKIARIAGVIGRINQISGAISTAVDGQGAAIREIARNAGEAATGTREVAGHIKNVGDAAGESKSAAADVMAASGAVGRGLGDLRRDVTSFLEVFRAA